MNIMPKEKKDLAVVEKNELSEYHRQSSSVENMIMTAIKEKVPAETMERFLAMRKELKAEFAKEQFDRAMANFQAECPIIKRAKDGAKTKAGELAFKYAPLEAILEVVKPLLKENGLSYNFKTVKNDAGKTIGVRCYASHINGHSDYSEMAISEGGGTPLMSGSQISAANLTFSKRYAFNNIFGIVTENEDNESALKAASPDQIEATKQAFNQCTDAKKFNDTWNKLPKELKGNPEIITYAKEIKDLILSAKKNEST